MAPSSENHGVLEQIMDGLQKQIDHLGEVITTLDHKVRGNGQPGIAADLASVKTTIEHIEGRFDNLEDRVVGKIAESISHERDLIQSSLKDTAKLKDIARQVAEEIARNEVAKKANELNASMDSLRTTLKEKENEPGSWRYFVDNWATKIIVGVITGVLVTLLLQWYLSHP